MGKRFFVYGTLRKNNVAHRSLEIRHAKFHGETRLPGYDMFELGWFPGIRPNPDNKEGVLGEVYEIPEHLVDEATSYLDAYEGYHPDSKHNLYLREEIEIDGQPTSLYVYNGRPREIDRKIESGDWNDRKEG